MSKKFNQEIETKIYGENSCFALFKKRPEDIIQVFLTKEKLQKFSELTKYCAKVKKAYHLVSKEELDEMTKATHHENILLVVKKRSQITLKKYLEKKSDKKLLLGLENVSNPHNIGAIMRIAAHFGVEGILLSDLKMAETPSAIRTSEGGYESILLFETKDFYQTIQELKNKNFNLVTTSSHAENSLYQFEWPQNTLLLFGEEGEGLSKKILKSGTSLKIPGTDNVESLNVSVATGIILSDYYQKNKV